MRPRASIILPLILLLILNTASASPAPEEEWNRTYGGEGFDYAYSVLKTSDGYIIAGVTNSFGKGREDAWLLRIDSEGNELWNKTFGGILEDAAYSITEADGGYIIAGHTKSFGNEKDLWLVKIDKEGNELWNKTIDIKFDVVRSIWKTDNGYVVAGEIDKLRYSDIYLVKFNSSWEEEWNITLGGSLGDYAHTVLQLEDGYIVAGNRWDYKKGRHYAWLMKADEEGNELWNKTFGGPELDVFTSLSKSSDGFIIAGFSNSAGNGREDVWILRIDSEGNELWNKTFGGILEDAAYSIAEADGGYIIAGHTRSEGHGIFPDAWIIKVSKDEVEIEPRGENLNANESQIEQEAKSPGFEAFLSSTALILVLFLLLRRYQKKS